MRLGVLILEELRHRWLNSLLALLTLLIALACLGAALALLREHRLATSAIIAGKEQETRTRLAALTDDMRRITVRMGFNILVLPKEQNLGDFYADDYASRTMPEDYAQRLADSGIATINHILPSLQQKIRWDEQERTVLLIGVRGEVTAGEAGKAGKAGEPGKGGEAGKGGNGAQGAKKPLLPSVRRGEAMLGHDLHRALKLAPGAVITLRGQRFTVSECRAEKGTKDDISIWIHLGDAQALLGQPGRINAILALECNCATVDRLGEIRQDIARILPDTQVLEYESQALARAEARNRAETEAVAALAAEHAQRDRLEQEKERLAALVVPLALVVCGVLIGLLSWQNVRERAMEIAILRAIGVGTPSILLVVLSRAAVIGLLGSALGYAAGLLAATAWVPAATMHDAVRGLLTPDWLLVVLAAGPLLAMAAAWLPALAAARQDPANQLREG